MLILTTILGGCGADDVPIALVEHQAPTTTEVPGTSTSVAPTTTTEVTTTTQAPVTTVARVRPTTTVPAASLATLAAPAAPSIPAGTGSGACGGSLPPCSVMRRESGGNPSAIGYGQCGSDDCFGKWQIDPDTAESVGYPRRLDLQPESVQDDAARAILARDGCAAWSTC